MLIPGIQAPEFDLPAADNERVALSALRGRPAVLVFLPAGPDEATVQQLGRFEERRVDLEAAGAALVAVSSAQTVALSDQVSVLGLVFPLLHDDGGAVAARYGVAGQPAVFVLDDAGVIRRVYEPEAYPSLPNPAMVVRAVAKLAETPRPSPVCAEDWCWGPPDAPVTLVEYADYQCVPCGETFRVLQEVLPRYPGQVRLIYRHLPIRITHPLAQGAAEAAEAAGAQGKFWEMHTCLFEARGDLARERLMEYAGRLGLDVDRFAAELEAARFKEEVNADFAAAQRNRIRLPPALFINGILFEGPRTVASISEAIDRLLACSYATASAPQRIPCLPAQ